MEAITFLGTAKYSSTTYLYNGREYETRFFAEALPHFFPDLELVAAWSRLRNLRNDLAHVGMNENPQSAEKLCRAMSKLHPDLDELAAALLTDYNEASL